MYSLDEGVELTRVAYVVLLCLVAVSFISGLGVALSTFMDTQTWETLDSASAHVIHDHHMILMGDPIDDPIPNFKLK